MIIGLAGYANTGKGAVAEMLAEHDVLELSFAARLKELALELDPVVWTLGPKPVQVSLRNVVAGLGWENVKQATNARDYLVALGAGARKHLGKNVWIEPVLLEAERNPEQDYVISDVRYVNEAEEILTMQASSVVYISRPGVGPANEEEARSFEGLPYTHTLENNGTLAQLEDAVYKLVMGLAWQEATEALPRVRRLGDGSSG